MSKGPEDGAELVIPNLVCGCILGWQKCHVVNAF